MIFSGLGIGIASSIRSSVKSGSARLIAAANSPSAPAAIASRSVGKRAPKRGPRSTTPPATKAP
jgi:hypothetical protein